MAAFAHAAPYPKVPDWEQLAVTSAAVRARYRNAPNRGHSPAWSAGSFVEHATVSHALGAVQYADHRPNAHRGTRAEACTQPSVRFEIEIMSLAKSTDWCRVSADWRAPELGEEVLNRSRAGVRLIERNMVIGAVHSA